ncbi:glucose-6-phosphate isomerase [Aneurinibacillus aneurinilyticus]|jgi:glucose-6-phosphate isomerase|uniref:Glucose-6-phosphate isomerase n=2 Tax=Aneurinibacillus aneurinilyticus TaxID=1391 RepID=A0A848CHJ2_ANEAE|nr:glucose-6-phosphate isomerase [Aneurinibacillus aneurinilyticus]ERI10010.1 glucose-6-phosphate isomerase [Aneurinibacillus aneurinilyticus ATCC 12856]MCI1692598.1 glucose-6-phosphate isomerase [Aneurinibacillus aneurinilyticus]MED0705142.1 glucose-6-phosphate isomerase [Aneurinibacillus aneurinilyticus]MED0725638.1 glucose-6-phosphate isomerase [Aneurinibacillus aneurinilyticus]MED0733842.1 glucose-6-phosphate isomerase [Aneurinibacillus aneurinilyticus]
MKKQIAFDGVLASEYLTEYELDQMGMKVQQAHDMLSAGTGPGGQHIGWVHWPETYNREEYARLKQMGETIRNRAEAFIVIGIGGSYLGARAAIEMLCPVFYNQWSKACRKAPEVYFAGHQMSALYTAHLLRLVEEKEIYINVISKSGTTLEPMLAFRLFREMLEKRYGKEEARKRIIVTTDLTHGPLRRLAEHEGYETFAIPDNIGGRYAVLTPVGLLPMVVAGIDVDAVLAGAADVVRLYGKPDVDNNPAYRYAALRCLFYDKGKTTELLASYEPGLRYVAEWWKQLFGESEGKGGKGVFPASLHFSTDLHSLGQYIQEGRRDFFMTTLWVEAPSEQVTVPAMGDDTDELNYLSGVSFHEVNRKACEGAMLAHTQGGVPNLRIIVPEQSPYYFGQLVYFFEKACGISGYLFGVNPFDQPGVEAYKRNMFRLLGKPKIT